jgi:putative ABC transport system permease protein
MVGVGEAIKLGDVRGLGKAFPLRGRFTVRGADGVDRSRRTCPRAARPGCRSRRQRLSASLGDRVQVGDSSLRLVAWVVQEPEVSLDYFAAGPKVFLNLDDIAATGLEQPGSRIVYRLVVAGTPAAVEGFVARRGPRSARGQRLETAADARPEVRARSTAPTASSAWPRSSRSCSPRSRWRWRRAGTARAMPRAAR